MALTQEQKIAILLKKLDKIENNIDKYITILNTTSETSSAFYIGIQKAITKEYDKAKVVFSEWNKMVIPDEYNKDIVTQIKRIKDKKYKPTKKIVTKKFLNTDINKQTVQSIIGDSISTYFAALDMGSKQVFRYLRATQQSNLAEKQVNKIISDQFQQKGSSYYSKKKLRQTFEKVIDGKYITIINKNGQPMTYTIKYYADLVVRTKLAEAQALSTVNTAMAYDTDLIQVSSHNTTTPICIPYEGKIFSLTGKNKNFPQIDTLTPFHPNCMHTITIVFEEALKINGTYDKYVDFSNGKTFQHPTKKSFIPTNDIKARIMNEQKSKVDYYNRTHKRNKISMLSEEKINKQVKNIEKQLAKTA